MRLTIAFDRETASSIPEAEPRESMVSENLGDEAGEQLTPRRFEDGSESYSPEALAQTVAALDDQHVGDRVNIFLARLCFRGIYFPMMSKSSWLRVIIENRRTILRLFKEGWSRWMRSQHPASQDSFEVATPDVSGEANV